MNRAEKRQQQRYRLTRHPDGRVFLRSAGVDYPIRGIRDVSNHGLSVNLERALAVSSPVEVEYRAARLSLTLNGVVAWCREQPEGDAGGFMLGVELFCPQILLVAFQDVLTAAGPEPSAAPPAEITVEHASLEAPAP